MITYTIKNLKTLEPAQIVLVVGYKTNLVKKTLGSEFTYAEQKRQLGTAHAAVCGLAKIEKGIKTVLIVNGDDSAFYSNKTLKDLLAVHFRTKNTLTFLTARLKNPYGLGRVVRDKKGKVIEVAEEKMTTNLQKEIKEVNAGCYLAKVPWLKSVLAKVKKSAAGEYYLVDIVKIAVKEKEKIGTVLLRNRNEWQGVNTPEELKMADLIMRQRLI